MTAAVVGLACQAGGLTVLSLAALLLAAKLGWDWRLVGGQTAWSASDLSNAQAWFKYKFDMEEIAHREAQDKAKAQRG